MMVTAEKLTALRQLMQEAGVDYYYVPSADAHQNEYVPECWQRRRWISGFTGSAGDVLVGLEQAYLWTDGRYFLQAEQELDLGEYTLMRQQQGVVAPIDQWLAEQEKAVVVAVDPQVMTIKQAQQFSQALAKNGGELRAVSPNWIDALQDNQELVTGENILLLSEQYSGRSTNSKLSWLRQILQDKAVDAMVLTVLDEIAWLLNIRGQDIEYNPLVISYVIISQETLIWFVNLDVITPEQQQQLKQQGIQCQDYAAFGSALAALEGRVLMDPHSASWWCELAAKQATPVLKASPIVLEKAMKNAVEQEGAREAHRLDAANLIGFMQWLETHWQEGYDECEVADKLHEFRAVEQTFKGESFSTISGFGSNGAIIHYEASAKTAKTLDDSSLFLLDSGGQYLSGTTDITRTFHFGEPTAVQKHHYTLVLKGHLALRHAVFPAGTCGMQLDTLARQFLWQDGLNYLHGTSHGVGSFLCVHEGPQRVSPGASRAPLEPGMIISNEPGIYFAGEYGIRIENLCLITQSEHEGYYTLEDLTLVPYARNLIELGLLTDQERSWINAYHQQVFITIAPRLSTSLQEWLKVATAEL